jgi:hypothetical protein
MKVRSCSIPWSSGVAGEDLKAPVACSSAPEAGGAATGWEKDAGGFAGGPGGVLPRTMLSPASGPATRSAVSRTGSGTGSTAIKARSGPTTGGNSTTGSGAVNADATGSVGAGSETAGATSTGSGLWSPRGSIAPTTGDTMGSTTSRIGSTTPLTGSIDVPTLPTVGSAISTTGAETVPAVFNAGSTALDTGSLTRSTGFVTASTAVAGSRSGWGVRSGAWSRIGAEAESSLEVDGAEGAPESWERLEPPRPASDPATSFKEESLPPGALPFCFAWASLSAKRKALKSVTSTPIKVSSSRCRTRDRFNSALRPPVSIVFSSAFTAMFIPCERSRQTRVCGGGAL